MMIFSISRNSLLLGAFALLTSTLIAITYTTTYERIEKNKQYALEKMLYELIPQNSHNNNMLDDTIDVSDPLLNINKPQAAYRAYKDKLPYAIVLPTVAPDGYGGAIKLIIGILNNGEIAGVRVIPPHNETPGLGDKIELKKSKWILSFNSRSINNTRKAQWRVKKDGGDFDQFTGATITPRAVVNAVYNALNYYQQNQSYLFGSPKIKQQIPQE